MDSNENYDDRDHEMLGRMTSLLRERNRANHQNEGSTSSSESPGTTRRLSGQRLNQVMDGTGVNQELATFSEATTERLSSADMAPNDVRRHRAAIIDSFGVGIQNDNSTEEYQQIPNPSTSIQNPVSSDSTGNDASPLSRVFGREDVNQTIRPINSANARPDVIAPDPPVQHDASNQQPPTFVPSMDLNMHQRSRFSTNVASGTTARGNVIGSSNSNSSSTRYNTAQSSVAPSNVYDSSSDVAFMSSNMTHVGSTDRDASSGVFQVSSPTDYHTAIELSSYSSVPTDAASNRDPLTERVRPSAQQLSPTSDGANSGHSSSQASPQQEQSLLMSDRDPITGRLRPSAPQRSPTSDGANSGHSSSQASPQQEQSLLMSDRDPITGRLRPSAPQRSPTSDGANSGHNSSQASRQQEQSLLTSDRDPSAGWVPLSAPQGSPTSGGANSGHNSSQISRQQEQSRLISDHETSGRRPEIRTIEEESIRSLKSGSKSSPMIDPLSGLGRNLNYTNDATRNLFLAGIVQDAGSAEESSDRAIEYAGGIASPKKFDRPLTPKQNESRIETSSLSPCVTAKSPKEPKKNNQFKIVALRSLGGNRTEFYTHQIHERRPVEVRNISTGVTTQLWEVQDRWGDMHYMGSHEIEEFLRDITTSSANNSISSRQNKPDSHTATGTSQSLTAQRQGNNLGGNADARYPSLADNRAVHRPGLKFQTTMPYIVHIPLRSLSGDVCSFECSSLEKGVKFETIDPLTGRKRIQWRVEEYWYGMQLMDDDEYQDCLKAFNGPVTSSSSTPTCPESDPPALFNLPVAASRPKVEEESSPSFDPKKDKIPYKKKPVSTHKANREMGSTGQASPAVNPNVSVKASVNAIESKAYVDEATTRYDPKKDKEADKRKDKASNTNREASGNRNQQPIGNLNAAASSAMQSKRQVSPETARRPESPMNANAVPVIPPTRQAPPPRTKSYAVPEVKPNRAPPAHPINANTVYVIPPTRQAPPPLINKNSAPLVQPTRAHPKPPMSANEATESTHTKRNNVNPAPFRSPAAPSVRTNQASNTTSFRRSVENLTRTAATGTTTTHMGLREAPRGNSNRQETRHRSSDARDSGVFYKDKTRANEHGGNEHRPTIAESIVIEQEDGRTGCVGDACRSILRRINNHYEHVFTKIGRASDDAKRFKKKSKIIKADAQPPSLTPSKSLTQIVDELNSHMKFDAIVAEAVYLRTRFFYYWNYDLTQEGVLETLTDILQCFELLEIDYHAFDAHDETVHRRLRNPQAIINYGRMDNFPSFSADTGVYKPVTSPVFYTDNIIPDRSANDFHRRTYFQQYIVHKSKESHEEFAKDLELLRRVHHPNVLNLLMYHYLPNTNVVILSFESAFLGTLRHYLNYTQRAMRKDELFASIYVGQLVLVYQYFDIIDLILPELTLDNIYVDIFGYLKVVGPWRKPQTLELHKISRENAVDLLSLFAQTFIGDVLGTKDIYTDRFRNYIKFLHFCNFRRRSLTVFREALSADLFVSYLDFVVLFNQQYDLFDTFRLNRKKIFDNNCVYN